MFIFLHIFMCWLDQIKWSYNFVYYCQNVKLHSQMSNFVLVKIFTIGSLFKWDYLTAFVHHWLQIFSFTLWICTHRFYRTHTSYQSLWVGLWHGRSFRNISLSCHSPHSPVIEHAVLWTQMWARCIFTF